MAMGEGFEVDPAALRAAAADLDEHAAEVAGHGEMLDANTASPVGHGTIGEAIDAVVKRSLRIVAHDLSTAVHKFYTDAATVMRKTAAETERSDAAAKQAFDDLGRSRSDHRLSMGRTAEPVLTRDDCGLPAGVDPTPDTIRQGTVRMEEHPEYARLRTEMEAAGYPVEYGPPDPRVERVQYVDQAGNVLRVEQRVVAQPGMRFLDLEHEIGHVRQLRDRFGGNSPFTERLVERPGRPPRPSNDHSGVLSIPQNAVAEFHNRLQEYNRLAERGASPDVLDEHRQGLRVWHELYRGAVFGYRGKTSLTPWARDHFPEIPSLIDRYKELGGTFR